jgi:hypothetical protein
MGYTIIIVFGFVYLSYVSKVSEWSIISALGFKTSAPEYFLNHENIYHYIGLFIAASIVISSFFLADFFTGFSAVIVAWLLGKNSGKTSAFSTYRMAMKEMMEIAESEDERKTYEIEMNKTNTELKQKVKDYKKPF